MLQEDSEEEKDVALATKREKMEGERETGSGGKLGDG